MSICTGFRFMVHGSAFRHDCNSVCLKASAVRLTVIVSARNAATMACTELPARRL